MAGNSNSSRSSIWYSRCTPVVVSSLTPLMPAAMRVHFCGSSRNVFCSTPSTMANSAFVAEPGSGTAPARSYSTPLWTSSVASPPSSRIMLGPSSRPRHVSICSVHHQYSSSVSPFHAKTGMPFGSSGVPSGPTTAAAAAWSCVEKMLQLAQRTSAPSEVSVSMSTAVWIVMCSEPVMRAALRGCSAAYFSRSAIRPGISCCASSISLRPYSARERSATLKSVLAAVVVVICPPLRGRFGSVLRGVGEGEEALVLLLLPAQPVACADALGALCRSLEPGVDRLAHLLVLAQPLGEGHVGEGAVEPGQQHAQGAQALQLARSADAIARVGPVRLDQPDALEVAEHSRRPAGRLGRFVDCQAVGHARSAATLARLCQGSAEARSRFRRSPRTLSAGVSRPGSSPFASRVGVALAASSSAFSCGAAHMTAATVK